MKKPCCKLFATRTLASQAIVLYIIATIYFDILYKYVVR